MNVLLINVSPHKNGCTHTALSEVAGQLNRHGIDAYIFHIGARPIRGCIACGKCVQTGSCVFNVDPVNECVERLKNADGLVVGSPVYYAAGPARPRVLRQGCALCLQACCRRRELPQGRFNGLL